MELFPLVSCLFLRKNYARSWAFPVLAAFSLRAPKLNQQSAVTYDMVNREEAIDNKGPRDLFRGFCLPCLSEMLIRLLGALTYLPHIIRHKLIK